MGALDPPPPDGGEPSATIPSLPAFMNKGGDSILQQTLLLQAVSSENLNNIAVPSPTPSSVTLPTNPFVISQTLQQLLNCDPKTVVQASKEAKGTKYVLRTISKSAYLKLLGLKKLTDGTDVEIIPHPSLNFCQGIVYDIDTINLEKEEMQNYLSSQNVTSVRRITKKNRKRNQKHTTSRTNLQWAKSTIPRLLRPHSNACPQILSSVTVMLRLC